MYSLERRIKKIIKSLPKDSRIILSLEKQLEDLKSNKNNNESFSRVQISFHKEL